ncbi:MAG TPA: DUF177 domain-containing protein [Gaiellaceae bacterium]|nr:DUF177 domain-containing protein [Gaiellaceae bacterium]
MTSFNLRNARLRPAEQFRDAVEVDLEPLELGGQRYVPVPERPEAVLTLTRTSSGLVLELELATRVLGPCMRCLADAGLDVEVAAREYQASSPGEAEELTTPYVADDRLDLSAWAHDAVVLALPDKILCREDCAGLCPVCGKDLNREPHEHEGEAVDPRWQALADLRDRL